MFLFGPPTIEKMNARRNVQGLIKALRYQKDACIRLAAAESLGQIRDARDVGPLIVALSDSTVRERATSVLAQMGTPAVEPLIAILKGQYQNDVTIAAAEALGKIADPRSVKPLCVVLMKNYQYVADNPKWLAIAAIKALGVINDPDLVL